MVITLEYQVFVIKIFDDTAFSTTPPGSTSYDKIYQHNDDKVYSPVSKTAIVVHKDEVKITSAILLGAAGATSVSEDCVLLDDDNIIVTCCDLVFSLKLPDLSLNWITKADWATCFSIYKYQDTYISYGELSISRIDRGGRILWKYIGADIFVTLNEGTAFEMHDTFISITDFNGCTYKIDYDGNTINYDDSNYYKQKLAVFYKKPWWKFW